MGRLNTAKMLGGKTVLVAVFCAAQCVCAYAVVTGANISGEARISVEKAKPNSTFETQALPPEPDYASADSWAALPDRSDAADIAPANTKYPESQASAITDLFFIHPTTAVAARDNWNIPIDDPAARKDLDGIIAFSASAFNSAAKVYAPRYREAAFYSFFDDTTDSGIKAIELAYRDVERAFLYYIEQYNEGRPFILAGHSQGSIHGMRILQEHIIGTPLEERMVAAYLIGGPIPKDISGVRASRSATDTGVVIGWNTYTEAGDPAIFTDGIVGWADGSYIKMGGRPLLETNPLSWELNGPEVSASRNPGSLQGFTDPALAPILVPGVCGADASGKVLIIDKPAAAGFALPENFPVSVLNTKYGDYHDFDYPLFYESIRKNAVDRVKAFLSRRER